MTYIHKPKKICVYALYNLIGLFVKVISIKCDIIYKNCWEDLLIMAYYQRIRDLREDSDKKQIEVADFLGTTAQYYGLYERGINEIPFERAIMLAKYYNVSLDYIAGLTNKKTPLDSPKLTKEEAELIAMLNDLSPKSRKKFAALLKQMINTLK